MEDTKRSLTTAQLAVGDPIVNSIGMILVPIPTGDFVMGCPESEDGRDDAETMHSVKLTEPFYLGQTVVTQGQWTELMGTTPWKRQFLFLAKCRTNVKNGAAYPATYVRWSDAVAFCEKLSEKEGVQYRLPTEAEWEYACRAGTTTAYAFEVDSSWLSEHAWFTENPLTVYPFARIVGQKKPNLWGLHDMHGNVSEWCQDWYGDYSTQERTDPAGPSSGLFRVNRGGNWYDDAANCRSAARHGCMPTNRNGHLGFRVLRSFAK